MSPVPHSSSNQGGRAAYLADLADALSHGVVSFDGSQLKVFLSHYNRYVEDDNLFAFAAADVAKSIAEHLHLGLVRSPDQALLRVFTPDRHRDGYTLGGATVVQLVMADQPFIVDTLALTVARFGWSVREIVHPQFRVARDIKGSLIDVVPADYAPDTLAESWVTMLIGAPLGQSAESLTPALTQALTNALDQLHAICADDKAMARRIRGAADAATTDPGPISKEQRTQTRAMLNWLLDDHFVPLGYREYVVTPDPAKPGGWDFTPVLGSGLGLMRGDQDGEGTFNAYPQGTHPDQLVITKDSDKSTIHRFGYRDYVGMRIFNKSGDVVGERRLLGLFTTSAQGESIMRVPMLRGKAGEVMARIGHEDDSHGGQLVRQALESFPRDELYQAHVDELEPVIAEVAQLTAQDDVRLFLRRGTWGRFMSALVYFPRERFTTAVRNKIEQLLLQSFQGEAVEVQTSVTESVLARLYLTIRLNDSSTPPVYSAADLQARVSAATRDWDDDFNTSAADLDRADRVIEWPDGYKEDYSPDEAVADLGLLNQVTDTDDIVCFLYLPDPDQDRVDVRIKVYTVESDIVLSDFMPHLASLGVQVIDEHPYHVCLRGQAAHIYDFGLQLPAGSLEAARWVAEMGGDFAEALEAGYRGQTEIDDLNLLVTSTRLTWNQVRILRAIASYLRQAGTTYSQSYLAAALTRNLTIAEGIVELFEIRLEPARFAELSERLVASTAAHGKLISQLDSVPSLDDDRILRQFISVVMASLRTNYWVGDAKALAIKLRPRELDLLPEPRPAFEIFVHCPRVEGVHLRYGKVARGGLRWSDRAEDYRTEVLGLVKAQMVKNAVIVPAGAKGCFFPRRLTGLDREARAAEGLASYQIFVASLLSVTDNLVDGAPVTPDQVIALDDADPYLVVAADKGTATFSDTANAISMARGFWLGDAFASGGSNGYDHKEMGITARGAWESVKAHFHALGVDCQAEDFTCVGIGDMSGDVFGNGMLLSRHIRLIGAFNHQHIFLDPNPDAQASYSERKRLFELPRSTWADYDASAITDGGGVFERTLKAIPVTKNVATALGLDPAVTVLTPNELITAILRAPVDLLWNGGIGTYVKAASETHTQVGDRANDGVRINGEQVRAKLAAEGGNLGWTQLGRIEYAASGGLINTDFIDNSAGVDTSDHEVNIKILLDAVVRAGQLTLIERNAILPGMADEIADLVLRHNISQNGALSLASSQAAEQAGLHEDLIAWLVGGGDVDRDLEFLPSTSEMQSRISAGRGLMNPELCTLLSWTKIRLEDEMLASDLPDDPFLADRLTSYFPTPLRTRFAAAIAQHPLRREIITTVAVNRFVDSQGIIAAHRLAEETGAPTPDVIRGQLAARSIIDAGPLEIKATRANLPAATLTSIRLDIRYLVERAARWVLHAHRNELNVQSLIDRYKPGVQVLLTDLPSLLTDQGRLDVAERVTQLGADNELVQTVAGWQRGHLALPIVRVALANDRDPLLVGRVFFQLSELIGIDTMIDASDQLSRDNRWDIMASAAIMDELHALQELITGQAIATATGETSANAIVHAWFEARPRAGDTVELLHMLTSEPADFARMSVGLRSLRGLVG